MALYFNQVNIVGIKALLYDLVIIETEYPSSLQLKVFII